MRVVPGSEAAHSGPTYSGGRGVRIAVRRILVDDRTHANLPGMRFPWICISSAPELAKSGLYRAGGSQNQGAASVSAVRSPSPRQGLDRFVEQASRHRLALADRTEHRHQHSVEAVGTFDVLGGQDVRERPRGQQDRTILPAAQAPVGTDERFECRDIERDVL